MKWKKNHRRGYSCILLDIIMIGGITLFFERAGSSFGRTVSTSLLFKLADSYQAGTIYDRNKTVIGRGVEIGKMEWGLEADAMDACSNLIGTPIQTTFASSYTVLGMAAPNLYGYYQNRFTNWKDWLFPRKRIGDDVTLTIDCAMQEEIYKTIKNFSNACVTVINYKTGEILAMVSVPIFDIRDEEALQLDENGVIDASYNNSAYINKNLHATYMPGSTIKPILLAIALDAHPELKDFVYICEEGNHTFGNMTVDCFDGEFHGKMNLNDGIRLSCNGFAIAMSLEMSEEELEEGLKRWELDAAKQYENRFACDSSSFYGKGEHNQVNRILGSIGQGNCRVNIYELSSMYGAIFFNGIRKDPVLIQTENNTNSKETIVCTEETAKKLQKALISVVEEGTGASYCMKEEGIIVGGKTGTADVNLETGERTVWAVAGILEEDMPYVVTVCLADQGKEASGGTTAGPVMKEVLKKIVSKR